MKIGDIVFLKTDPDQRARIVIGIFIRPNGKSYYLSCGVEESFHYEIEMSTEPDIVFKTGN